MHDSADAADMTGAAATLAEEATVILCAGTGGVGKTTVAAALGVRAAAAGRRVAVITVDPARRLADTVGLPLGNDPARLDGPWPGELWAMMLDPKATFDALVAREAGDAEQTARILDNRLYQNLSGVLSGTQEFMANEKLCELHQSGRFDLIVVDTPPTRNALEFLEAPEKLVGFLDGRLMRLLFPRSVRRAVNLGLRVVLHQVASVIGSRIVDDGAAFLRAFQGMEDGFRERARQVGALMADDTTAVVLVTTPRADTVAEARWFAEQVTGRGLRVGALVANRVQPSFSERSAAEWEALADEYGDGPLAEAFDTVVAAQRAVEAERETIAELAEVVAPAPTVQVPLLSDDVHDLAGIEAVSAALG